MPIDLATLAVFVPVVIGMSLTPGPDALFVLSRSIANGPMAGIMTALGTCAGLYVYAGAIGLGLSGVFAYSPLAFDIIRTFGVLYLIYLAWQSFRSAVPTAPQATGAARGSPLRFFWQGVVNDLTNPKAVLFFVAFFPQFLVPAHGNLFLQAMILNTIGNIVNMAVLAFVAVGAGKLARWLGRHPRIARIQQWFVGCIFLGLAARLAFTAREL